jgi:hypothetical protein
MWSRSAAHVVFGAFLVLAILSVPVSLSIGGLSTGVAWAQEQPPANPPANPPAPTKPAAPPAVHVDVHTDENTSWIVDPFWLIVGGIGLLAILALLVAAGRTSTEGTTVIKT